MGNKLTTKGNLSVTQDNGLIKAAYSMTTLEKRLLLVSMSKLNPVNPVRRGKPPVGRIKITAEDWANAFPNDPNPYRSLARSADNIMARHWRADHCGGVYVKHNWLACCSYDPRGGGVELNFTEATSLRLHGLSASFTTLQLHQIGQLVSFNQIRLYEHLCQFRSTGYLTIKLEELKRALGLEDRYTRWADFRKAVIAPSVKAINKETDLLVTYKPYKLKRNVAGIEFTFAVDQQQELDL